MRSRLSEVSQRRVRQPLVRLLLPGLLLGLPFSGLVSCKTGEGAKTPVLDVTAPRECKIYHKALDADVTLLGIAFRPPKVDADATSQEIVSGHPLGCLEKGGKVRFINHCSSANALLAVDIKGPEAKAIQPLPRGNGIDHAFSTEGTYTITAEGCPDISQDAKTGTLEVGTGPGEDVPPGKG
ncbi:hypothetical protein [Vitiosangium sp. GDMCC 1.1324]|uniref:hypothetical protein n=1 Tax=Vitiosangium sp. (strain GDMCC 1.1324) TaxID=2138576 RepID=UPI000D3A5B9F|nr:hypothetical protein [Vitiosangium sp. GDMCC 1.1324]PTL75541.1 hypothetical protein DAT35_53945 [Vitiosangium sp. GDMCC 1.1324]